MTLPSATSADLVLPAGPWYRRLSFQAAELAAMCQPLVSKALAVLQGLLQAAGGPGPVGAVVLTPAAAHLPGLAAALQTAGEQSPAAPPAPADDDFGEGLLQEDTGTGGSVHVLGADAVARAAHEFAVLVQRGDLPAGILETIPLPAGRSGDAAARRPHDTDVPSLRLRLPPRPGDTGLPRTDGAPAPRWHVQPHED